MLVAVEMQADIEKIIAAREAHDLDRPLHAVRSRLMRLERRLSPGPFFDGDAFANVDAAFAPVLRQLVSLEATAPLGLTDGLPRLAGWTQAVLSRPSVQEVIPEDHALGLLARLRASDSVLLSLAVDEAA
jgi:glutathione S-transferase